MKSVLKTVINNNVETEPTVSKNMRGAATETSVLVQVSVLRLVASRPPADGVLSVRTAGVV